MLKTTALLLVVFSFIACDKDFETIGSDIIGEPGFNANLYDDAEIVAHNNDLAPVQTNNLPVYLLGVYNDPVFGSQTASILTQLQLASASPDFGEEPVLDSVVLSVPYFYSEVETEEEAEEGAAVEYELDSVYGNSPIKLSIIESDYYLNDYDPETDFQGRQKYFSNLEPTLKNHLKNVLYETENFVPSADAVIEYGENSDGEEDTLNLPPRMRIALPNQFFQEKILDKAGTSVLSSNSNFRNYFRGIYLEAEAVNDEGTLMLLDIANPEAGITLYYTSKIPDGADTDDDGDTDELVEAQGSYQLNFGPNKVNTFEQEVPEFDSENLYLKGGEGSMAIIELFGGVDSDANGVSDELESIRESDWLINEANLTFYVNQQEMAGLNEPERLYLYDLENNRMLVDYVLDQAGQQNQPNSRSNENHLGVLERNEDEEGIRYKIRITQHINNVLNNDSTNVKLGLVVSQNVNLLSNSAVLDNGAIDVDKIPTSSVIAPEGTVLYGPEAENEEKYLKLNIYYTEPKN